MAYVIEKDNGEGKAPSLLASFTDTSIAWCELSAAHKFASEQEAQDVIDNHPLYGTEIVEAEDETVFEGTRIKSVEVLNGMKADTKPNT